MKETGSRLLAHAPEVGFGLIALAWMGVGFVLRSGVDPLRMAAALEESAGPAASLAVGSAAWLLAALCLVKLAAPFVAGRAPCRSRSAFSPRPRRSRSWPSMCRPAR